MNMRFKRNTEVIEKALQITHSGKLSEEEAQTIDTLIRGYCSTTYAEWDERHEFSRQFVSDMVNDFGFQDDELADMMVKQHPTLQQNFMRFVVKFLRLMAEKPTHDLRNKNSVIAAKMMANAIADNDTFPHI